METGRKSIAVAVTGASGVIYGSRLVEALVRLEHEVHLVVSDAARVVLETEAGETWPQPGEQAELYFQRRYAAKPGQLVLCGEKDWFCAIASGSAAPKQMVVCPCSMGTLAAIAQGQSNNLLERAADVVIKERGRLVLVPRETPLSLIHLQNFVTLAQAGATILPANPGFYNRPSRVEDLVDFVVARVLDQVEVAHELVPRWGSARDPYG